jgi:diguanylate cyclase (GGDEF)-like protein
MGLRELEDPAQDQAVADLSIAASRGRRLTAVPIDPEPGGDPGLAPLGLQPPVPLARPGGPAGPGARGRRSAHAVPSAEGADQRIADRIAARVRDTYGLSNTRAAPLRVNGRVEGAIVLARRKGAPWPASADGFLRAAAIEASAALARVYSLRDAEARATTDALTGLPNRRYFDEYVGLLARRRRAEDRVGVLMVDIDRFKGLNDTFGHAVGDHVLREVAGAIAGAVRDGDIPARFGGEEFAVLLRNPSPKVAVDVGERVRRAVGDLDLRRMGVPGVSVSVGVAVADESDIPLGEVIDAADRALYRAKRGGRDRVVAA